MDDGQRKRNRAEEESTEGASTSFISPAAIGVASGQYDVFLSFRGLDTCKEFTDHLYNSLVKAGTVNVFKADKSIPIGEDFGSQIFDAITRSKISIPIISENYASSKWCLRDLIHIMDCKKSSSHMVLPIFYNVASSDVRHLKGNFGKAFRESEERFEDEDVQKAKKALREVSDLHGWESTKVANGHEEKLIQLVVETVQSKLQKDFQLDIPRHLVGLDDRLNEIMNWICIPSTNARMIGLYGMGGIGKTTLAKCIYNQLLDEFKHASFLPGIRDKATHHDGMEDVQNKLISDILRSTIKVSGIDDGINIIKSRFKDKKVLILLDDIDDKNQLDVLARERDWFMAGSMIIVTTRNEAVLVQSNFGVDYKYEMKGLDVVQSLLLFNRHAFGMDHSPRDFESISRDIITTMDGLPLALVVVGSYLYMKTNKKVWERVRRKLKSQPHEKVEEILRISYDALEDGHKQIFLDIACFFINESLVHLGKHVMCLWEDCELYPSLGIEELKSRCLIKIGKYGELEMHIQLRNLGRSIFCQGQSLEKSSRLWDDDYEGVPRVLRHHKCPRRFNDLIRTASSGDEDLSEVRWLEWRIKKRDSSLSPANLHLSKLAVLDLAESDITEDWEGWSSFKASTRLRALNLANCWNLKSAPDLSSFTQLKFLSLNSCRPLEHLHPSIGKLKSLVSLDLSHCESLEELPVEVGELKDLEELHLRMSGITRIPVSICSLGKLKELDASHCRSLREIPSSIGNLQNLEHLDIHCSGIEMLPSAIERLKNLQNLNISRAPISDLPQNIQNLSSLLCLDLGHCDNLQSVPKLPLSLEHLVVSGQSLSLPELGSLHLEKLYLQKCHLLEDVPYIASRLWKLDGFRYLEELSIHDCSSIERLDLSELVHLKRLEARDCNNLDEIQGLDNLEFLEDISIWNCNSIKSLLCLKSWCLKGLSVSSCSRLVQIAGPFDGAKFLERLFIQECKSLETLPDLTGCEKLRYLVVQDCKKLTQIRGLEKLNLQHLDVSYSGIEELPSAIGGLKNLQTLDISGASIFDLPVTIWKLSSLQRLYLGGCKSLKELPKEVGELKELEEVTLDDSGIVEIPTSIGFLRKLKRLSANRCHTLREIPSSIAYLQNLEHLHIRYSAIKMLPSAIGRLKNLRTLDITGASISDLPRSIQYLSSLQRLCLGGCESLKELPKEVGELKELEELELDHSGITEIPTSMGSLRKLKKLSVIGCGSLREIPSSNGDLQNLQQLDISHSTIERLLSLRGKNPSEIGDLSLLKVLDLACCNYLRYIPDLSALKGLEILILKHCDGLEQVHPSVGKLKSLVSLDLSDCGSVKELPKELGKLEELKHLILDSTGIIEIPTSIGSLRKLEKLSAYFCRSLRKISNSIGNLQNLQDLDISHSAIEKLPIAIGRLKKLRRLNLKFCYRLKGEILNEVGDLSSLEILDITGTQIVNVPDSICNLSSLRCLSLWGCYELKSLPKLPFSLTNLSVSFLSPTLLQLSCLVHLEELDLYKCVLLEYIPELPSRLRKLCVASCHKLILPKFDVFQFLEELSIKNCGSIERLDLSMLNRLKWLHAEDCYNLVEIQSCNLKFLEEVVIDCCKSIERLIFLGLQCLKQLKAKYCDNLVEIQGLHKAEFLEVLDISYCESIEGLPDLSCFATLKELNINGCCNLRGVESLERFLFCRSIYITGCQSLEKLPDISKFKNLENFTIRFSLGVTEIPGVDESRSLTHIDITGCKSMEILPDLSRCEKLQSLVVRDCKKLTHLPGLENLHLIYLDISGCNSLETVPKLPETSVSRNYERAQDEVPDGNIILQ